MFLSIWGLLACVPSHTPVTPVTPNRFAASHNDQDLWGLLPLQRGVLMAKGRVSIVVEHCKSCGFCVEFCPSHVLALSSAFNSKGYHPPHVVHPEKCSGCDLCGMYCPDFAIFATKNPNDKAGLKADDKGGKK
jgi:2-oxoglutarate ferredoxin oxidoreductase subunit delta